MAIGCSGVIASTTFTPIVAQVTSSLTDERIRFIVIALLVVAFLLGTATVWFFIHTSPTRRVREAARRRGGADRRPSAAPSAQPSAPAVVDRQSPPEPVGADDPADDDDDWIRLTGPEQPHPSPRRSHG